MVWKPLEFTILLISNKSIKLMQRYEKKFEITPLIRFLNDNIYK